MLQHIKLGLLLTATLFLVSSFSVLPIQTTTSVQSVGKIEKITVSQHAFLNAPSDWVNVNFSTIEDEIIMLNVTYKGGCGTTTFKLVADSKVDYSSGYPIITARLSLKDDDKCTANVNTTLKYDLSPLKTGKYNVVHVKLLGYGTLVYNY